LGGDKTLWRNSAEIPNKLAEYFAQHRQVMLRPGGL